MADVRWGIIGFGEAGVAFARHIVGYTGAPAFVTDPLLNLDHQPVHIRQRLEQVSIKMVPDIAHLAAECDIVLSLVTASAAREAAAQAGAAWQQGLLVDLNSTSPIEKQRMAGFFKGVHADSYVDGAILGSIAGEGVKAPLALAGPRADQAHALLSGLGLNPTVIGPEVGGASALKMCRSIFMKGVECLFVETLLAARQFDIEAPVLKSIEATFGAYTFADLTRMLVTTHAVHAGRRSHEMEYVVQLLQEIDMPSPMSAASLQLLRSSEQADINIHFNGIVPASVDEVITFLAQFYQKEEAT